MEGTWGPVTLTVSKQSSRKEPQVRGDVTEVLVGLSGFVVRDACEVDGELHIDVELADGQAPCPGCGTFSGSVKQRPRPVRIKDAPSFGRRVIVWWWKRRFRCRESWCRRRSFTETAEAIRPRARTSERLRELAWRWVRTRPVLEVAAELGVDWRTVWRHARARIEDRLDACEPPARLGLDETSFRRPQRFVTGFVDLDTGRLVDLVQGRSRKAVADWLVGFGDAVDQIEDVAMDPYSGFNRAVQDHTNARVTMDRFHCVRLANQALTDVRCRRQQEITGHRGRKGDPLWRVRRDLLRARERLTPRAWERIRHAFAADTDLDVECGWVLKETLRDIYAEAQDQDHAHRLLVAWYQLVADYDVAEFIRLARTISQWEDQFLAYFETRLTNGRTEARNLVIKQVKRTGYGFTNFDNYRLRVLHRCS